jgi:hypothetical protein
LQRTIITNHDDIITLPPTGSAVALLKEATGDPVKTNGTLLVGFAPKEAVSVRGLPHTGGGAVTQNCPGVNPPLS